MTAIPSERPDYGIDAPGVVRNLFVAGALCLSAWAVVTFGRFSVPKFVLGLAGMAFGTGVLCMVMGLWMLWDSRVGKLRRREWLLNRVDWSGHEQVLDVGCGRGLLLIGATFRKSGVEVRRLGAATDVLATILTFGGLRPATFVARKA